MHNFQQHTTAFRMQYKDKESLSWKLPQVKVTSRLSHSAFCINIQKKAILYETSLQIFNGLYQGIN